VKAWAGQGLDRAHARFTAGAKRFSFNPFHWEKRKGGHEDLG
jgi:hypothetical protein